MTFDWSIETLPNGTKVIAITVISQATTVTHHMTQEEAYRCSDILNEAAGYLPDKEDA